MSPTLAFKQSIPYTWELLSICIVLAWDKASIELIPEFSAKIKQIYSRASAKALIAYYSTVAFWSATFLKLIAELSSDAPPPTIT